MPHAQTKSSSTWELLVLLIEYDMLIFCRNMLSCLPIYMFFALEKRIYPFKRMFKTLRPLSYSGIIVLEVPLTSIHQEPYGLPELICLFSKV